MSSWFSPSQVIPLPAFSLFIVCPRMAAMTNLLDRRAGGGVYSLAALGTVPSLPLLLLTAWALRRWGLMAGLPAAVDFKAALETLIIAAFVAAGNRLAVWVASLW